MVDMVSFLEFIAGLLESANGWAGAGALSFAFACVLAIAGMVILVVRDKSQDDPSNVVPQRLSY